MNKFDVQTRCLHPLFPVLGKERPKFYIDSKFENALRTILLKDFPEIQNDLMIMCGTYKPENFRVMSVRCAAYDLESGLLSLLMMSFTNKPHENICKKLYGDESYWYNNFVQYDIEKAKEIVRPVKGQYQDKAHKLADNMVRMAANNKFKYATMHFLTVSITTFEFAIYNSYADKMEAEMEQKLLQQQTTTKTEGAN